MTTHTAQGPSALGLPRRATALHRFWAGFVALGCLATLVTAAVLRPNPSGTGTHEQLGLPPCSFKSLFAAPCPTCGMTTAFAHAAHAQPLQAAHAQPFGALLALLAAVSFWVALHVALTGSSLGVAAARFIAPRLPWLLIGGLLLGWGYTLLIARA